MPYFQKIPEWEKIFDHVMTSRKNDGLNKRKKHYKTSYLNFKLNKQSINN